MMTVADPELWPPDRRLRSDAGKLMIVPIFVSPAAMDVAAVARPRSI
jgi:hypothetical protein